MLYATLGLDIKVIIPFLVFCHRDAFERTLCSQALLGCVYWPLSLSPSEKQDNYSLLLL